MKFGVKVVDKSSTKNKKRLNKQYDYYKQLNGCELAIYNGTDDYIKGLKYHILHTETHKFSISLLINDPDKLNNYIYNEMLPLMKREGIKNIVVHILPGKGIEEYTKKQISQYIKFCSELSIKESIGVFVENTFDTTKSVKEYFDMDPNKNLNFCFDIGHAKALGKDESIGKWLDFIADFKNDVHIHFHANRGERDEHLPITTITNNWINDFHEGNDYKTIMKDMIKILAHKENSSLIMETYQKYMDNHIKVFKELNIL